MRVYSIFKSINGEVTSLWQGSLCVFVRLAGCNLSCTYCDTRYAKRLSSGEDRSVVQILGELLKQPIRNVTITGGEPLLQSTEVVKLVSLIKAYGFRVSVETNGSRPLPKDCDVDCWVVDYKLRSSGMNHKMLWETFSSLRSSDVVKFVVGNRDDFEQALGVEELLNRCYVGQGPIIAFSPVFGLDPSILVDWMIEADLSRAVLNLQLHKYIWPDCGKNEER